MFALLDPDEIHSACETYKKLKDRIISLKCVTPSFVIVNQEEKWFVATDISTNVASQGKTISEALVNLKEALELYYEDEIQ